MGGGKDYTDMVEKFRYQFQFLQNFITFLSLTNLSQMMMMLLHLFKPLVLFHSILQFRIVGTWLLFHQWFFQKSMKLPFLTPLFYWLKLVLLLLISL